MARRAKDNIRNFCIVAHIDHGKSTLADRIMEMTGQVAERDMEDQLLDSMDLERERGITIKLTPVRMAYTAKDGKDYVFNLIDTPGHVDFTYEVSRSLAACEGAILIVDATQGIEAQTLANCYLALDNNLEIVPVINKIDLASADPDATAKEIEDVIGLDGSDAPRISAKNGTNIDQVLEQVVKLVPPPDGDDDAPLSALIFDSYYDNFKGVICFVRIMDGTVGVGTRIKTFTGSKQFDVTEVGTFNPHLVPKKTLSAGEVGYIAASIKSIEDVSVGDTITDANNPAEKPLPGYKKVQPVVFSGIYPLDGSKFLKRVVTFALPGGIATALSVLLASWTLPNVMGWDVVNNDADLSALRATSAIILFLMGVFVLARVARPLNSWRGALVAGFAAAGIIGAFIPFVANFFALILPTGTALVATLIALGGAAMIFVICLWLAPLVGRIFGNLLRQHGFNI